MIAITGANGRLGRLVASELARLNMIGEVVLTSRDPSKLDDLAALGFQTAYADFGDVQSMRSVFERVDTALMISMPGPVEERIPRHRNCVDAARDVGVGRLVYTSRVNPTLDSLYPFAEIHADTETYLKESGLTTTIIRNSEYLENIVPAIRDATKSGELIMPGAIGKVPHVAVTEIAEVLARVLVNKGHGNQIYELNAPEAMSRDDIAALIAMVAKRSVMGVPASAGEFGEIRRVQGRPQFMVEMAIGLFKAVDAGEFAKVWPDMETLLGRRPHSVREFILKDLALSYAAS